MDARAERGLRRVSARARAAHVPPSARLTEPPDGRGVEGRGGPYEGLHAAIHHGPGRRIDVRQARHVRELARRLRRLAEPERLRERGSLRAPLPAEGERDGAEGGARSAPASPGEPGPRAREGDLRDLAL